MAILETTGVIKQFGALVALNGPDITIEKGEIVGLVGPNGSGKTTWINVICGFLRPTSGNIIYRGRSIAGLPPYKIARRGLIRTFQLTSLFPGLPARENILSSRYLHERYNILGSFFLSILQTRGYRDEERKLRQDADKMLSLVGLKGREDIVSANLQSVEQRKLEIAIALAGKPELLMLDEPAAGMNPNEMETLMPLMRSINQSGITLLIVEHNMKVIMEICTKVVVFDYGNKIAEGTPKEVVNNKDVIASYLGQEL